MIVTGFFMSGRQDSNLRPPGPKPGTLTGLRYAPKIAAVRPGFEPGVPVSKYDGLANRWFKPLTHLTLRGHFLKSDCKDILLYYSSKHFDYLS